MKALFRILAITSLALNIATAGVTDTSKSPIPLDDSSPPSASPCQFEFTPYFWLADLKGTVTAEGAASAIDIGFEDVLHDLDFAFSTTAGVRYDRFGLYADFLYMKLSPSSDDVMLELKQTMFDPKASYRLVESNRGWLDLLAGARYMNMDLSITLLPGTPSQLKGSGNEGWWDAVGGLRGRHDFTDRIFLTGMADVGGGSSELTWQAQAALGYQFNEKFAMTMGYRYLDYDYKNGDFAYDVVTQGFYVGLGFTW